MDILELPTRTAGGDSALFPCEERAIVTFDRFDADFAEIAPLFIPETLSVLRSAYNEPLRRYHTQRHITYLLKLFARLRNLGDDPLALKASIYFHDAVYQIPEVALYPRPRDNEERSIRLMQSLAYDDQHPSLLKAVKLIRATANHHASRDIDVRLMHDLDLSILASSRRRFAAFEYAVRMEYQAYAFPLWATARMARLRSFMERRRLYALPPLSLAWEERARANLAWAIAELVAGRTPGAIKV